MSEATIIALVAAIAVAIVVALAVIFGRRVQVDVRTRRGTARLSIGGPPTK